MNVTAEIAVNSVQNVLTVPVSAVNRGNTVLVKGAKGAEGVDQTGAPSGAKYVQVELGLNNDSFIEVTKGLSEGDTVLVPVIQSSTEEETSQQGMVMMGPGGGGGSMSGPPPDAMGGGDRSGGNSGGSGSSSGGKASGN
jgi:HlyD family secretion protein